MWPTEQPMMLHAWTLANVLLLKDVLYIDEELSSPPTLVDTSIVA